MVTLYLNFRNNGTVSAAPPWVNQTTFGTWDQTGQKFSDIDGSGVSIWVTAPFVGSSSSALVAEQTYYGIPKEVWQHWAYTNAGSPSEIEIRGLPASTMVTVSVFAAVENNRDLDVITNQGTFRLDHPSSLPPPAEPLAVPVLTDGSGTAVVQFSAVTINASVAGLIIEYSAGPSITTADNITDETQPATVTLANNTAAPTAITINGTAATGITDDGAGVYSYTPPLIADDATATLEVTVDGSPLTTTISYANSYPYELVTHGTPNANSIFSGTQFATSGPVEWGVVTDYNPAIVIVNHAAMDAAEDELNDVGLHSTEVSAGTTTATYKYFVPESGETGTFQASITVEAADTTAPTVTSVTVPTAGTYTTGQNLNFTVNLDKVVTVSTAGGTPSIPVTVGATVRQATYVSGSGTSALLFRYTVQAGDEDTDGVSVGASISLNGGTIQDAAGNNLVLTLNGVGDTSGVLVDGVEQVTNPATGRLRPFSFSNAIGF